MKHTLKILVVLLLLASVLLTGCAKESDTMKEIKSQLKTLQEDYKTVVAEYDGGNLTMLDVMPNFASMYSYYYQIYAMFGMSIDDEMLTEMKNQTMEYLVQCRVLINEFDKRGLTLDKTEEEYNTESDETYNEQVEYYVSQLSSEDYTDDEKQAYAELIMYSNGLTLENLRVQTLMNAKLEKVVAAIEEEAEKPTEEDINTYYEESVAEDETEYSETPTGVESAMSNGTAVCWMPEGYRTVKHILVIPETEVLDAVTDARSSLKTAQSELATLESELAEVTAADEEPADAETAETTVEATEAPVEEAETAEATEAPAEEAETVEATEAPAEETAEATEAPAEEAETAETETADDAASEEEVEAEATEAPRTVEEIQADIDSKNAEIVELQATVAEAEAACLESVKEKTDAIYAELEAGNDFDTVMATYGEDPGMQSEPNMTTGYYVREDSVLWDTNFRDGAMALAAVGDYSAEPVISSSGVHIIYYASDVTPGQVPLEDVYDALYEEKEEAVKNEYLKEWLTAAVEAVNPQYYVDKWTY